MRNAIYHRDRYAEEISEEGDTLLRVWDGRVPVCEEEGKRHATFLPLDLDWRRDTLSNFLST